MNSLPSVSVILAVKNGAQYLEESLRSVLAQDHRPYEVLVVDDESTDETESRGFALLRTIRRLGLPVHSISVFNWRVAS